MQFDTLERKVRRLFGDENNIVIDRQDIIDWANAAQVDIARTSMCLPTDLVAPANTFPLTIADLFSMYRATYGTAKVPKTFITLEQIDVENSSGNIPVGVPQRYYIRSNIINLHPVPATSDTTPVTVTYNRAPHEMLLADNPPVLDVPVMYHEDVVRFCLARAYEKNENYQAQEMSEETYTAGLAQRIWEKNQGDESFPYIRPDPMDYQ